jgi:hypothetical protein
MKRYLALYFVLTIILIGCASNTNIRSWSKVGATDEKIKRDSAACQDAVPRRGARRYERGVKQISQQGYINFCMRGKGYQLKNPSHLEAIPISNGK